jgi:uncharacterized alpha-E superfamily protein
LSNLLARYAECLFWLARYVERAENLARILDVNQSFSRDGTGAHDWRPILQLYNDEAAYLEQRKEVTPEGVIAFYVIDQANPGSIFSSIRMARENARALRPLISTEMWSQLNVFHNQLQRTTIESMTEPNLNRICSFVKESCQAHTGVTEGTFFRDEGWQFYRLGKNIERADQTTRLLDVKYRSLLPLGVDPGSAADIGQWYALIRSASGYHAFRRIHPTGLSPKKVAKFLLLNRSFPRSISACADEIMNALAVLGSEHELAAAGPILAQLAQLRHRLETQRVERILESGLHNFADGIQLDLINLTSELGRAFFGHIEPAGPATARAAAVQAAG